MNSLERNDTESATQITRIDHRRGLPDRVLRNAQGTLKDSTSPPTIINKSHHLLQVQYCSILQSKMLYIFLTLLSILVVSKCEIANVTVNTSKGTIIGVKRDGYSVFFGVPYAKVNEDNPFGSYLVHPIFQDPFFANDSSIFCPQVTTRFGGTLQCLRLNIYVPNTANVNSTVPVLVWFYGGGFTFGSAQEYGGEHLIKHGIIVVTVNYRLGPYGFMCLNDAAVPGNQGLKDQIGALRWVRKNIEFFGGDPTKVTIAGQSYGGGAVDLHLYSKYETLFEKVIIQSGSLYTPGFYGNRDHDAAIKLAHQLGFRVANTREALEALGKENPVLVMNAAKNLGYKMTVCKEVRFKGTQQFVTKCINHLSNPDRIENIPIMIGYNSKEDFATYANKPMEFFDSLGDIFYKNLQNHFVLKTCELETLSNITKSFYLGSKRIGPESILELSEYSSDFKLNYAVEKSVSKFLEQGGRVYKYMFSYIGGSVYQNITGAGAVHTEELKYLFETGVKLTSDEQRLMRNRMTTMWTNFVKLGNPTPQKTPLLPVTWTPVSGNARQYLNIDIGMSMKDYAYRHRMAFWDLFMQKYDKKS